MLAGLAVYYKQTSLYADALDEGEGESAEKQFYQGEDEKKEEQEPVPSLFEPLKTQEEIKEVLNTLGNRMIFMKHGIEKKNHLEDSEDLAAFVKEMKKLKMSLHSIDVSIQENKDVIVTYLKERGSFLDEKTINSNSFILGNKSNDIWF